MKTHYYYTIDNQILPTLKAVADFIGCAESTVRVTLSRAGGKTNINQWSIKDTTINITTINL